MLHPKTPTRAALRAGQTLNGRKGRYRIVKFVGEGANARVYQALADERHFAVKVFAPRRTLDRHQRRQYLRRFRNEVSKLTALRHWNVVSTVDSGVVTHLGTALPFIVLEYIPATLQKRLARGPSLLSRLYLLRPTRRRGCSGMPAISTAM